MKKSLYLILLITIFIAGNIEVTASSGALKKDSIKTCNGITYGQHSDDNHWHVAKESNGRYYATGSAIYSDPCSSNNNLSSDSSINNNISSNNNSNSEAGLNNNVSTTEQSSNVNSSVEKEEIKSNDNTLKSIIIDGKEIDIEDNIYYSTTKEKIIIEVVTNDDKAKYEIKDDTTLEIGENKILIEVTAEDGTVKTYNIYVKRDKILSSNTGIKVIINDKEINFSNNKAMIYVSATEKNLRIDYILNDKNSKVEMNKIEELTTGDNELMIKVIAEDGTEKEYEIILHKYAKSEEIIARIIVLVIISVVWFGIYFIINKVYQNLKRGK